MMTEDDAKTKWCPMARNQNSRNHVAGFNRIDGSMDGECYCIGSRCMMWRVRTFLISGDEVPEKDGGYCGLAGKP